MVWFINCIIKIRWCIVVDPLCFCLSYLFYLSQIIFLVLSDFPWSNGSMIDSIRKRSNSNNFVNRSMLFCNWWWCMNRSDLFGTIYIRWRSCINMTVKGKSYSILHSTISTSIWRSWRNVTGIVIRETSTKLKLFIASCFRLCLTSSSYLLFVARWTSIFIPFFWLIRLKPVSPSISSSRTTRRFFWWKNFGSIIWRFSWYFKLSNCMDIRILNDNRRGLVDFKLEGFEMIEFVIFELYFLIDLL